MNKLLKILILSIISITPFIFSSCEIYPEGKLSIFSSEYRLVNVWEVSKSYKNGVEVTETEHTGFAPRTYYYIYGDHVLRVMARYNNEIRESTYATWVLDTKSKTIQFNYTLIGKRYFFTANIRKLSRQELIIEFNDENSDRWRLEMLAQSSY